jgi:apolipoprotein N-acyltransferase
LNAGGPAGLGRPTVLPLVVAAVAGLLQALSTTSAPVAALDGLALLLLYVALQEQPPWRAACIGWTFATVWLTASVWWLFISMHRYGELPAVLASAAVLVLALFLGGYTALASAAFAWVSVRCRGGALRTATLFACCWLMAELARAQWFTGFPWASAGYAHVDGLLGVLAPWLGVYGMGAVAAWLAALLGSRLWVALAASRALRAPDMSGAVAGPLDHAARWRSVALALGGAALLQLPAPNQEFTRPAGEISVTLLQGNVAQDEKFDPARLPASLAWHDQALRAATTELVLAPETALPLLPEDLPAGYWASLRAHFDAGPVHALFGMPLGDAVGGYTNSAVGLAPGGRQYRYDKHHLVPFGEFIPLGFRWFVDLMKMPLGDFNRGVVAAPSFQVRELRVAPNICYEDLFGEDLAAGFVDPHAAPHVLANLSNIGWFGQSVAVQQHLQISRLRALELQRPMLRATNTGATVIIDHQGTVTHALEPHRRGVLQGVVQGRSGNTPFAFWAGRWGLWPLWGLALGGLIVLSRPGRRRAPVNAAPRPGD